MFSSACKLPHKNDVGSTDSDVFTSSNGTKKKNLSNYLNNLSLKTPTLLKMPQKNTCQNICNQHPLNGKEFSKACEKKKKAL